jgi:glycosyltransferase involved in cell wall biosynthesis
MEYFGNSWQIYLASFLRFLHPKLKIYSIIHLPYTILIDVHKPYNIVKYTNYCNKVFVFGSSLKRDLINGGCTAEIVLSHHYVDVNYYKPGLKTYSTPKPTIIIMGDMMRNKELILDILCHLQYLDLQVIYCGGRSGVPARIKEFKNIESYEYLSEDSLLKLMQKSDISLNVFNDTIGSNVIVTSMAVGLAIVASNVGSITDYCDNDNAILCPNDTRAFVHAIDTLIGDVDLLKKKQEASLLKAKMYSVENSISSFFK